MKSTIGFILFVAAVLGFLFLISGKKYPQIPADENHFAVTTDIACMVCHGPDKRDKLKATHPPKFECFKCHKVKRSGRK